MKYYVLVGADIDYDGDLNYSTLIFPTKAEAKMAWRTMPLSKRQDYEGFAATPGWEVRDAPRFFIHHRAALSDGWTPTMIDGRMALRAPSGVATDDMDNGDEITVWIHRALPLPRYDGDRIFSLNGIFLIIGQVIADGAPHLLIAFGNWARSDEAIVDMIVQMASAFWPVDALARFRELRSLPSVYNTPLADAVRTAAMIDDDAELIAELTRIGQRGIAP